jgi:hypothetical protein
LIELLYFYFELTAVEKGFDSKCLYLRRMSSVVDLYRLAGIDQFLNTRASFIVLSDNREYNIIPHALPVSISVSAVVNTDLMSLMLINGKPLVVPFTRA